MSLGAPPSPPLLHHLSPCPRRTRNWWPSTALTPHRLRAFPLLSLCHAVHQKIVDVTAPMAGVTAPEAVGAADAEVLAHEAEVGATEAEVGAFEAEI